MKTANTKFTLPTVFVIFGVTGDLMKTKLLWGLFNLYIKNLLPKKMEIIGFSRRHYSDCNLRDYLRVIMTEKKFSNTDKWEAFLSIFFYIEGQFDDIDVYKKLARKLGQVDGQWRVCSNKLFYLAVPPTNYRTILTNLHDSGLTIPCSPEEGWTRVILEKPFGSDLKNAQKLDELLGTLFKEEQIYRVDHFLGKETVRNIIAFRFSNSFLSPTWNNKFIEKIEFRLFEKKHVSERGDFYDAVGALRDVGQNHLLQVMALFTMSRPAEFTARQICQKRAEVLSALRILSPNEIEMNTLRGQYDGYKKEKGVSPNSQTETYFKVRTEIQNTRWRGVRIILEAGKAMKESRLEVLVTFKHQYPCLCPPHKHYQNVLRYQIQPHEKITTMFLVKKPGHDNVLQQQSFKFDYQEAYGKEEFIGAYEKLLFDMIKGDQTLFVTTDEILEEWKFVEPILQQWQTGKPELFIYPHHSMITQKLVKKSESPIHREIGLIGLGKMGGNLALQTVEKGWKVVGFNRSAAKTDVLKKQGIEAIYSYADFSKKLQKPRVIFLMLPAGDTIDTVLFEKNGLLTHLDKGDIIVDAGNSFYKDTIERSKKLTGLGFRFIDVGVSGGPSGARNGACLMIGGDKKLYEYLEPYFLDISIPGGVQFFEGIGAGHFIKMVHNGIEYGMMQALAEGFAILKKSSYSLDLKAVAEVYNHGSVIESRLVGWLKNAFSLYGNNLDPIDDHVAHTGEGAWTIETAKELNVTAKIIDDALQFRVLSETNPSYTAKIVSVLRGQFGGHPVIRKHEKM